MEKNTLLSGILVLILLLTSCTSSSTRQAPSLHNRSEESGTQVPGSAPSPALAPPRAMEPISPGPVLYSPASPAETGSLILDDHLVVNGIGIGSTHENVELAFGLADRSSPAGDPRNTVQVYDAEGVAVVLTPSGVVRQVTVRAPSQVQTSRGIGVGATEAAVTAIAEYSRCAAWRGGGSSWDMECDLESGAVINFGFENGLIERISIRMDGLSK